METKKVFILLIGIMLMLTQPAYGVDSVGSLPWSTTFDCDEWEATSYPSDPNCTDDGNAIYARQNPTDCGSGNYTSITSVANYPGGGGGRGMRKSICDGVNSSSTPIGIDFNPSLDMEIYVRFYMRYGPGFTWNPALYDKLFYFNPVSDINARLVFDLVWAPLDIGIWMVYGGAAWSGDRIHSTGNACDWTTIGDGGWHYVEYHYKADTDGTDGELEIWVDNTKCLDLIGIDLNTPTGKFTTVLWPSNQREPNNAGGVSYVDYDDITFSASGPIGQIDGVTVVITTPSSSSSYNTSETPITVGGTASSGATVTKVQWANAEASTSGTASGTTAWSDDIDLVAGTNTITATMTDSDAATTSDIITITYTQQALDVEITIPTDSPTYSSNDTPITVGGTASSFYTVESVVWANAEAATEGTATGTTTWSDSISLVIGTNTITATVTDSNFDTVSDIITITRPGYTPLFTEYFEDANFADRGWYDPSGNYSSQITTAEAYTGNYSWQCTLVTEATGCSDGLLRRKKFTPTETLYISYYIKHSSNWTGSNQAYHPHIWYFFTDKDDDWTGPAYTRMTLYVQTNEGTPEIGLQDSENIVAIEAPSGDLTASTAGWGVAGCNGDGDGEVRADSIGCWENGGWNNSKVYVADQIYFDSSCPGTYCKEDWHHVEAYVAMNSVADSVAQADGVMTYWFDGQVVFSYDDIVYRTAGNYDAKFNKMMLAPYIGDGSPVTQTIYIDEFAVGVSRQEELVSVFGGSLRGGSIQ